MPGQSVLPPRTPVDLGVGKALVFTPSHLRRWLILLVVVVVGGSMLGGSVAPLTLLPMAAPIGPAPRPPMGWNSWNGFGCAVSDALVRQSADALVASGMRDDGYRYITIDDCWMSADRDAAGRLVPDPAKFPFGMKALADYVHKRGLKFGIYESAGTNTCAGYPGSLDHEQTDAQTFASWGVDYLKYDNCYTSGRKATERYQAMALALRATGRPIVLALCEWGQNSPWSGWGSRVGAALWRTTDDIADTWASVLSNLNQQVGIDRYSGPNAWNDPDMLEVGNGGLTTAEYQAQFSLWALLNAPLIAGNDVRTMTAATRAILTNRAVIAVDQDWSGQQGYQVNADSSGEIWAKPMSDGSVAVVFLNRDAGTRHFTISTPALGLPAGPYLARDLWTGVSHLSGGPVTAAVPARSAVMVRLWPR